MQTVLTQISLTLFSNLNSLLSDIFLRALFMVAKNPPAQKNPPGIFWVKPTLKNPIKPAKRVLLGFLKLVTVLFHIQHFLY